MPNTRHERLARAVLRLLADGPLIRTELLGRLLGLGMQLTLAHARKVVDQLVADGRIVIEVPRGTQQALLRANDKSAR